VEAAGPATQPEQAGVKRDRRRAGSAVFALAVILVALGAAGFAILFRASLAVLIGRWGRAADVVSLMRATPVWLRVCLPALGGLVAGGLGLLVARSKQGHGVSEVMEAVVLGRVRLSLRVTLLKSLASWCAIASGGSLGREGPLIQFGGAWGKAISERLELSLADTRRLIAAGTAAGFAAAYNTPFAAVLFVIEVVSGIVVLDLIVPVVAATVIASEVTRMLVGEGPIYGQRAFQLVSPAELVLFALLGLLAALVAQAFMRLLHWAEYLFKRAPLALPWRPALGGLLAGAVIAFLPDVAGNGYEPLNLMIDAHVPWHWVLAMLIAKPIATSASVASGSPGGVFTPTLLLGGGVGYLVGVALASVWGDAVGPAGGYALVGMAASTAASTHAPLMAAVMAFELSGDYAVALPLLLATAVASAVSRRVHEDSIYGAELRARGLGWKLTLEGRKLSGKELGPPSP
jgi:CIC family chloride channel protein